MKTLDVGCGVRKYPGSIGIDRNRSSNADVICDLDFFPYPFADHSFDHLRAIHVIEHVVDVDRLALDGPLVAEDLHAVDKLADTV